MASVCPERLHVVTAVAKKLKRHSLNRRGTIDTIEVQCALNAHRQLLTLVICVELQKVKKDTRHLRGTTEERGTYSVLIATIRSAWRPHALHARTVGTKNAARGKATVRKSQKHYLCQNA